MNSTCSARERVERALRLLDWLAAEAPALDPMHVALRLDEVRDVLLPMVASDARGEPTSDSSGLAAQQE